MNETLKKITAAIEALNPKVVRFSLLAYAIVMPLLAVITGNPGTALILVLSALIGVIILRIDDIVELNFLFSLKVKLEKSIAEANATLAQLRSLALTLSEPVMTELALSGQFMKHETMASKQHKINKIVDNLKQLGVTDKEMEDGLYPWKLMASHRVYGLIYNRLEVIDQEKFIAFAKLRGGRDLDEKPEEVLAFLRGLAIDDQYLNACKALYIELQRTARIANPDVFDLEPPKAITADKPPALDPPKEAPQ